MSFQPSFDLSDIVSDLDVHGFTAVELFTGCGAMSLGLSRAGFVPIKQVEFKGAAIATIRHNQSAGVEHVKDWRVDHADVRDVNFERLKGRVAIVVGGPPCESYGQGGRGAGHSDKRNMWPEVVRGVAQTEPMAFMFEHVSGLLQKKFEDGTKALLENLERPGGPYEYHVAFLRINTADYGAAQHRKRVIIVGFRKDLFNKAVSFPPKTHSLDALLWSQWISGSYWEDHAMPGPPVGVVPSALEELRIALMRKDGRKPEGLPWRTVRDALFGLGLPNGENNHDVQVPARVYPGHTGSTFDRVGKALKAGDHGRPGGEGVIVDEEGNPRHFSVREAARLQDMPDEYFFPTCMSESMRQLGNALPVVVAEYFGCWLMEACIMQSTEEKCPAAWRRGPKSVTAELQL